MREKSKNVQKRNKFIFGIFSEQATMLTRTIRMTSELKTARKMKDTKSNLVVCFKSCFPNHFANVDSHVFYQMETC